MKKNIEDNDIDQNAENEVIPEKGYESNHGKIDLKLDSNDDTTNSDVNSLDDSVVAEQYSAELIRNLRDKLKTCEAQKSEYLTGWQRAKADQINAKKRDETERGEFIKYANENLISELIPVLDSFHMAMGNKEVWEKADKNWRIGVEYIYSQLVKVLKDNGLVEIDPTNQKYDHNLHEAISYEPTPEQSLDHVILAVIQKGYSLNGKVLKPAKVTVGEFKGDL